MESLHKGNSLSKNWILLLVLLSKIVAAQYAPAAGENGTTAMHKDSSAFVGWAVSCDVQLGLQDISNSSLGNATIGSNVSVTGIATGLSLLSLGDGGAAVLQFSSPIKNGSGPDFAVFENSFDGSFLELAFVEVSSDGINYERFPASSLTQYATQVNTFGTLNPEELNNLAGKYVVNYGTPFDLEELVDKPGLDVNAITHVKVVDVVGSIDTQFASKDIAGNVINDPWPTAFSSSGFDLDAVGVINSSSTDGVYLFGTDEIIIYPNPVRSYFSIKFKGTFELVQLFDISGSLVEECTVTKNINVQKLIPGFYTVKITGANTVHIQKILIADE
jgi:hypothetical protein